MLEIRHSGICCSNLEKADLFYKKILGLTYFKSNIETGEYIHSLLGLKRLMWIKLKTDNGDLLELYHLPQKNKLSFTHVAFTVKNIKTLKNKLIKYGIKCSDINIDEDKKHKVMFCRDPDANLLELVEVLKRK